MVEWNFVDKWFITKTIQRIKDFVVKATVSVLAPFQGFHNMHFICLCGRN